MSKHYIRKDGNNLIVDAFSDAFRRPDAGDICVNEEGGRHYNLDLKDGNGEYNYKYVSNKIVSRTEAEKYNIEREKVNKISQLRNKVMNKLLESDQEYIDRKLEIDNANDKTSLDNVTI